jgi:hypothetical protein
MKDTDNLINDLGREAISMCNTIIALNDQGYSVNSRKFNKLGYLTALRATLQGLPASSVAKEQVQYFYNNWVVL